VARYMKEGILGGGAVAVDASMIMAPMRIGGEASPRSQISIRP
jgi:hypothetical protein